MPNLTDPREIKSIMTRFKKSFAKSLGQNFLIDSGVVDQIADGCGADETTPVLEIGPGIGTLTTKLAQIAQKVVSVEIDQKLMPVLEYTLAEYNNITIINEDILKVDILELCRQHFGGQKARVAANLPYYITTPILMKLLEYKECFSSITVMVQKEVAQRMAAPPGGKDYASLSVAVQYYAKPVMIVTVPPESFLPPPKVTSSVIRLDILDAPSVTAADPALFFRLVHAAFGQRRKTLINSVANAGIGFAKQQLADALTRMELRADIRGERLSLEQFAILSDILKEV